MSKCKKGVYTENPTLPVFLLRSKQTVETDWLVLLIFAISIWSVFDKFVDSMHLPVFGLKNIPTEIETMTIHRAQRRFLLALIYFTQLIFFYASIYLILQERFCCKFIEGLDGIENALQLSFATQTTVGYGNYAPESPLVVLICMVQTATGLLMIGGSIAQMISILKVRGEDAKPPHVQSKLKEKEPTVSMTEWRLRWFLPPIITISIISGIYLLLK